MLRVKCECRDESIITIKADGHCGLATKGHDVLCAAISGMFCLAVKALNIAKSQGKHVFVIEGDGYTELRVSAALADDIQTQTIMKATAQMLEDIQDDAEYGRYISVEYYKFDTCEKRSRPV